MYVYTVDVRIQLDEMNPVLGLFNLHSVAICSLICGSLDQILPVESRKETRMENQIIPS